MKTDNLRSLASRARFSISTPGTLPDSVCSIATETADLIEKQQKTIEELKMEIDKLKRIIDQLTSRGY
jgi:hypothetical protein